MAPRIAFVGYNIAGCWTGLQLGLERFGVNSDVIGESDHPFQYGNAVIRPPRRIAALRHMTDAAASMADQISGLPGFLRTPFHRPLELLRSTAKTQGRVAFMRWLGERYDIIFVERKAGIGSYAGDIDFLASLNTKVVFVAFGSDMRPSFLDGAAFPAGRSIDWEKMRRQNERKLIRARNLEAEGATVIASPGTSHFFRRPLVDRETIGFPIVPVIQGSAARRPQSKRVVILHAPSNPAAKGTTVIRAVVEEAVSLGCPIDFRVLSGVPRATVADELAYTDFVIDQIYSDQYAGVLAREATSAGTRVIVGSHDATWLTAKYRTRIPAGIELIEPRHLLAELMRLCDDVASLRSSRVEVSNSFATTDALDSVVQKWLQVALGNIEDDWIFDPNELDVPLGGFAARKHLVSLASGWIHRNGLNDFAGLGKFSLATAIQGFAEG